MAFDSKELLLLTLQRIKCYITQSLRFNYSDSMSIIGLEVLHRSLSDFSFCKCTILPIFKWTGSWRLQRETSLGYIYFKNQVKYVIFKLVDEIELPYYEYRLSAKL